MQQSRHGNIEEDQACSALSAADGGGSMDLENLQEATRSDLDVTLDQITMLMAKLKSGKESLDVQPSTIPHAEVTLEGTELQTKVQTTTTTGPPAAVALGAEAVGVGFTEASSKVLACNWLPQPSGLFQLEGWAGAFPLVGFDKTGKQLFSKH